MLPFNKKFRFRKFVAGAAVLFGAFLMVREIPQVAATPGESWFWLLVAALAILLGIVELFPASEE